MEMNYIEIKREGAYVDEHIVVTAILMALAFLASGLSEGLIVQKMVYTGFVLMGGLLFYALHYYMLMHHPERFVITRRIAVLLVDIVIVTSLIALFDDYGLFLLPFYLLIVLRSGLVYGWNCFNIGVLLSGISWFFLYRYIPFWKSQVETLEMFAIAMAIVAVFFQRIILRLDEENMKLNQVLDEMSESAFSDELTGTANRKEYKETIKTYIKEKEPFCLLFIDLNKFKSINDNYGHHIGDEVLKEVVRRLDANLDEDDFLARLGGDEFVIMTKRKRIYMEKFVASLEKNVMGTHRVGSISLPIELSIGISCYPKDATTPMMLSKCADDAMYRAKKDPSRYHYFYHEIEPEL